MFKLLTRYSERHDCFVTELFMGHGSELLVCFRSKRISRESPNQHACVYMGIALECAKRMTSQKLLTADVAEEIDQKLAALGHLT